MMNIARRKFIDKNLDGEISISTMVGMYTTSVSCQVSSSSDPPSTTNSEDDLDEEIERIDDGSTDDPLSAADDSEGRHARVKPSFRMISSSMDSLINQLMRRSQIWSGEIYRDDVCLDGGFSLGLGLGGIGLSFSFTFSASVNSLQKAYTRE